jgi:hypothetical protein
MPFADQEPRSVTVQESDTYTSGCHASLQKRKLDRFWAFLFIPEAHAYALCGTGMSVQCDYTQTTQNCLVDQYDELGCY